jgi:hypothetical protein
VLADRLVVVQRLAGPHAREQLLALGALGRRRHREAAPAEHLLGRPAEDALGRRVPEPDTSVEPELHEREWRGVDQGLQPLRLLLAFGGVVEAPHRQLAARMPASGSVERITCMPAAA